MTEQIGRSWEDRQHQLGNTQRAVLYKNLPSWINESLHRKHTAFILKGLPEKTSTVLDVGCGYGRLASEIAKFNPESTISGVEICKPFAEQFESCFGTCFNGSLQDYKPESEFDVIVIVTVLMYVDPIDTAEELLKLWNALKPGGRLICIEQYENFLIRLRQAMQNRTLEPTGGGNVVYFKSGELYRLLENLPAARLVSRCAFGMLPILNWPVLHHGLVFQKEDNI